MSEAVNREGMDGELFAKSFLQSDGGISGLLSIKMALEELQTTLKEKTASEFHCPTHTDEWNSHNLFVCVGFA